MAKKLVFFLCVCAFSTAAFAEDSDIQIFDREQNRQLIIRQRGNKYDIYDKSWNRKGFIRDDKIYDERWNRKGSIIKEGDTENRNRP